MLLSVTDSARPLGCFAAGRSRGGGYGVGAVLWGWLAQGSDRSAESCGPSKAVPTWSAARRLGGVLLVLAAGLGGVGTAAASTAVDCSGGGHIDIDDAGVVTGQTNCTGAVEIPATATAIGSTAFFLAFDLTSVTFEAPSQLETIGYGAFYHATSLQTIALPPSVTAIGEQAFDGATSLTTITIPSGVTSIGRLTFAGTTSLDSVTFTPPSALQSIGDDAFVAAGSLQSITIPSGVTSIGGGAFRGAGALAAVSFAAPSHLETIGNGAFEGATSLVTVEIPSPVTDIGDGAFQNATGLTRVTFATPSRVTAIGAFAFYNTTSLTEFAVPNRLETIRDYTFDGSGVTRVSFDAPSSVTGISFAAFRSTSRLETITIPDSVLAIGPSAFEGAAQLTHIYFERTTAPFVDYGAFWVNAAGATAYHLPGSTGYDPAVEPNLGGVGSALYLPAPPAPTARAAAEAAVISVQQPSIGPAPSSFLVTASPGGAVCAISGASGSCTITGLTAGTAYTFTALAHLSSPSLTSFDSPASAPISPTAPVAPAAPVATATASVPAAASASAPFTARGAPRQLADALALTVTVNDPGMIGVRVMADGARALRAEPIMLCSVRQRVSRAGRVTLVCSYTRAARALLARGDVRATQTITFRPLAGAAVVATSALILKRRSVPAPSRVTG